MAYDPTTDHFWIADLTSDIFEINRDGQIIQQIPNSLSITGFAWYPQDENGFKLYIFSNDPGAKVSKMHPVTHAFQTLANFGQTDLATGCTITGGWNSTLLVFAGVLRNSVGAHLGIYEMAFNTTWISVIPSEGTVPNASTNNITIHFNPTDLLPDFTYNVNLTIHSSIRDTSIVVPVSLTVNEDINPVDPVVSTLPTEYKLYQNYPNPFNPSTTIRYDLKAAGHTKLVVYNVMGQQVATLVDEIQPAGVYKLNFDGSSVGSGLYFYRLESGNYVNVSKMVLMK